MRVLLLGGTAEARALAEQLDGSGVEVETSLAGRVARPRLPVGSVRIGGFGGVAGLAAYAAGFDAVCFAWHAPGGRTPAVPGTGSRTTTRRQHAQRSWVSGRS